MASRLEYLLSKLIKKAHLRAVRGSRIDPTSKICAGTQFVDSEMGRYSDIGYDCSIVSTTVGSFVSMGSNIRIGADGHVRAGQSGPLFRMGVEEALPWTARGFDDTGLVQAQGIP